MKFFTDKKIINRIIIAIIIITTINFISPTISRALTDDQVNEIAGMLFNPIAKLLLKVSDLIINMMQEFFVGKPVTVEAEGKNKDLFLLGDIGELVAKTLGEVKYKIEYSPGVIFSDRVPGLDVNFFKPGSGQERSGYYENTRVAHGAYDENKGPGSYNKHLINLLEELGSELYSPVQIKVEGLPEEIRTQQKYIDAYQFTINREMIYIGVRIDEDFAGTGAKVYFLDFYEKPGGNAQEKKDARESSAEVLQPIVATWYKTLRAIALVGLLSILVYIGIRILISSTGKEKAKYKKMITDWFVAICLLFVLQYIMIFTLEICGKITDMLSVNIIGEDGQDNLMSGIRTQIGKGKDFTEIFTELLIYLVLVIHTILFTVQYLKRLIYMAFFTMIAPLIALTYPLDKIKDGQAQAFSIWLKEYIFNSLLQPMHLLLYYIFITSASELVEVNKIYAIVAIGFLVPAEKFFRKMFGFDKAQSSGQLGAAVGGAAAMNVINSLSNKTKKQSSEKSKGSSAGNQKGTPRYIKGPEEGKANNIFNMNSNNEQKINTNSNLVLGQNIEKAKPVGKRSIKNGARTLAGHYNPFSKANGVKILKGAAKGLVKGTVGLAGAATLGTVGLAIGTATGDASKALGYTAAGAGAGFSVGKRAATGVMEFEKNTREIFKEGALGTDEYNTRSSIKELTNDKEFNRTCASLGIEDQKGREQIIRQFYNNGIDNSADIRKAMDIRAKTGASQEQVIAAYKIKKQADKDGLRRDNIEKGLKKEGIRGIELEQAMTIIDML